MGRTKGLQRRWMRKGRRWKKRRRRRGGGRRRNRRWMKRKEERRDSEMRDVRRDGLIEAFLIAFTPLHGLLYPRYPVSVFCSGSTSYLALAWLLLLPPHRFLLSFIPLASLLSFLPLLLSFYTPLCHLSRPVSFFVESAPSTSVRIISVYITHIV